MIAAAIGKPMAKATAIVDVIAKSRSSSGCTLSSSDMAYSTNRKPKSRHRTKRQRLSGSLCPEAPSKWCSKMVNKLLIAARRGLSGEEFRSGRRELHAARQADRIVKAFPSVGYRTDGSQGKGFEFQVRVRVSGQV
jgi:hypothetical protein